MSQKARFTFNIFLEGTLGSWLPNGDVIHSFFQRVVFLTLFSLGSGCCTDDRVVTSDTRELQFKSSQRQFYSLSTILKLYWRMQIKKKEASNGPV